MYIAMLALIEDLWLNSPTCFVLSMAHSFEKEAAYEYGCKVWLCKRRLLTIQQVLRGEFGFIQISETLAKILANLEDCVYRLISWKELDSHITAQGIFRGFCITLTQAWEDHFNKYIFSNFILD